MINILPQEGRVLARKEYLLRILTVSMLAAALIAIVCCALLFPSYLIANGARQDALAEASRLEEAKVKRGETTTAPLTLAKAQLALFAPLASSTPPSVVLALLLTKRNSGISISVIQYDSSSGKVTISGISATRDSLLSFFESIKAIPGVGNANLPVNDLAKNVDAPFSISIKYTAP